MKKVLAAFLLAWLVFMFSVLIGSTNAYERFALVGIAPLYIISIALFSLLIITWKENLFPLAAISSLYQASITGLPFLKYPLLYGTVFDTMFHYSLAQTIVETGHVPTNTPYFGFTTLHSLAAVISMMSGLPLVVAYKLEIFILPALVALTSFWIATDVLRKESTVKLAILGAVIAFTFDYTPDPQILAGFLVILSLALVLQFARTDIPPAKQGFTISILLLVFALVISHHQTAFFAIFGLVGTGLLLPVIKSLLRTNAVIFQRIGLIGLLTLGFAYLWWTYYAGFSSLLQSVFSIVTGEPLQFQTTVGRGIFYYGPITWAFRTVVNYAQRGQMIVWMIIGAFASGITLLLKRKWNTIDSDTHAVIYSWLLIFLAIYAVFLFVPFFVIGSDRFFRFMSFVAPSFIAIGIETVYKLSARIGSRINPRIATFLRHPSLHAGVTFLLLVLVFVELISPLFLGEIYAASSQYQYSQIAFLDNHSPNSTKIISHLVITNQFQVYAPNFPVNSLISREDSVSVLFALYSINQLPSYSHNTLILLQRIGPAGNYFEAVNYYPNSTWVPPSLARLLSITNTSLLYNSGEAFDLYVA